MEEQALLPELSRLIDLHELDKEILAETQILNSLSEELRVRSQEMEDLKAEQGSVLAELQELQGHLREMEAEVADLEAGITASRQRLMDINKELELKAMLKEIAFREDQRDQKETRVLELLEQVEAQNQVIAGKEDILRELQAEYDHRAKEVAAEMKQREQQRALLEGKRVSLREGLPAVLLKRYEFIRQRRNGSAIAEVQEGVCLGCHMNILPQQFIDLMKGEEILQCPHCLRILYWLGEEEEEASENLSRKVS
jgi:predicted  nucleic acid-binding Zn-ribbon protein